jgi:hypothetical protein
MVVALGGTPEIADAYLLGTDQQGQKRRTNYESTTYSALHSFPFDFHYSPE